MTYAIRGFRGQGIHFWWHYVHSISFKPLFWTKGPNGTHLVPLRSVTFIRKKWLWSVTDISNTSSSSHILDHFDSFSGHPVWKILTRGPIVPKSHTIAQKCIHVVSINGILSWVGWQRTVCIVLCCEFYTIENVILGTSTTFTTDWHFLLQWFLHGCSQTMPHIVVFYHCLKTGSVAHPISGFNII